MAGSDTVSELGPYRLLGELGRGGMGVLYEAEHTRLRRKVALKLLAPRLAADREFRERFVRESQLLAAMEHPSIIPIYDAGEIEGHLYIAMRYVEGRDLGRLLDDEGPLEPARGLAILEEVGGALDAAHARDLVHRDVKPANILLDEPSGRVFLTDFGVAKRGRSQELTQSGALIGTVDYAAPEQLQGEAVGPAADVYALGCVLFETLSGRRVFEMDTDVAVMFAHALEDPPTLTAVRPDLPEAADQVLATAMAKSPEGRYSSCRELVAAARTALGVAAAPAGAGVVIPVADSPAAAPLRSNLPAPGTPLVGRDLELSELEELLTGKGVRLVTLTGPGGTGKTRLAIELAASLGERFTGGSVFVDLVPVSDPSLLVALLAETLGVDEQAGAAGAVGEGLLAAVCARLQGPGRLLVLDNFEHLLAAAPVVGELLGGVPGLTLVVTSQAPLHLTLEREYPVPPLAVPEAGAAADVDAAARSPAIVLFLERARVAVPGFELDEGNVAAVSAICERLDGLPLAIELAVARLRLLSPQQMLERLESTLELLTGGARDLPARHQTLRAAIDWSYGLLEQEEQMLLERLAVFSGGFTLEAAEAVAGLGDGAGAVLAGVESLVEKNLLSRRPGAAGETRLAMLQSIQEYALFRLLGRGEIDELREQHARFYLSLAERAEPELIRADQADWVRRLELEAGNLRAALAWALERGELELGMRAAGALTRYWSVRGHMAEGRRWLEQALHRDSDVAPRVRAKALYAAGYAALGQGDFGAARERFEESLALARTAGDEHAVATALAQLGWLDATRGDGARAEAISEESLALARRLDDPRTASVALANLAESSAVREDYDRAADLLEESLGLRREAGDRRNVANALLNLGRIELARGRDEQAGALLEEGLALARELGDTWGVSVGLSSLAVPALTRGDPAAATSLLEESLTLCSERRDRRLAAECLAGLAAVSASAGDVERAARLAGAAEAMRAEAGAVRSPVERRLQRALVGGGGEVGAAERVTGAELSFEAAVVYALSASARGTSS